MQRYIKKTLIYNKVKKLQAKNIFLCYFAIKIRNKK